jgi:hypothetical protein
MADPGQREVDHLTRLVVRTDGPIVWSCGYCHAQLIRGASDGARHYLVRCYLCAGINELGDRP